MPATSALLEREEELATIERCLDLAAAGDGRSLTIEGEAGAGKTSLLEAAADLGSRREMLVLRARGGEYERDFPYGVVRQLFESLLADEARRAELLTGSAALAAPVFEPEAAPSEAGDRFAIEHGLYWLAADLAASTPLLMLIDDAQWADLASLRALTYIGRRLDGMAAVLALSVRTGESGAHVELLDELRAEPAGELIVPSPLSERAAGELIAEQFGEHPSPRFASACRRASAGNPFLLGELLRALGTEKQPLADENADRLGEIAAAGVARSIQARLARLGEPAVEVARAVAILEPNAEPHRVATLATLDSSETAEAAMRLIAAGLLEDDSPFHYVHPLVRSAVYAGMPEPQRALLHGTAAKVLGGSGADVDAIAAQLLLAPPAAEESVVGIMREAARQARDRGAHSAAIEYLRRALAEPPPGAERHLLELELGSALLRNSDGEGIGVLLAVRSRVDDPLQSAEITKEIAIALGNRRRQGEAQSLLVEAIAELESDTGPIALMLRSTLALLMMLGGSDVPGLSMPRPKEVLERETGGARQLLGFAAFLTAAGMGTMAVAEEIALDVTADRMASTEDALAGFPPTPAYLALTIADRWDRVCELDDFFIEATRRRGVLNGIGAGFGTRALCRFLVGELDEAEADAEVSRDLLSRELAGIRSNLLSTFGSIAIERGELAAAEEQLFRDPATATPESGFAGAALLCARGELRLATHKPDAAREEFLAAKDRIEWIPYPNPELIGWRSGLARAEAALGNRPEADRLAAEAVANARAAGGTRGIGLTLRIQGALCGGVEGIEILHEAVEVLRGTESRLQHAHALVDLGAALRRANHRKEARQPLREGLDLAYRCGALPLEERARTELAATGARSRKAMLSGVDSLTPSELRVARLAVDGMTNREIAQQLFVTAKTVETHLRHAYQKLGVARRTELVGALDR